MPKYIKKKLRFPFHSIVLTVVCVIPDFFRMYSYTWLSVSVFKKKKKGNFTQRQSHKIAFIKIFSKEALSQSDRFREKNQSISMGNKNKEHETRRIQKCLKPSTNEELKEDFTVVQKIKQRLSSIQFSRSVKSNSLWPCGLQHTRLACPSPTPGACSNSCPSN